MWMEEFFKSVTFEDFLIRPHHGMLDSRKDANLTMQFSRRISIKTPIVGANMDTVTGENMMKALSLNGCFGFIHRNCSIEKEARQVAAVKRQQSFIVSNPLVICKNTSIGEAKRIAQVEKVSGLLVEETAGNGILVGVLSRRDFPTGNDEKSVFEFMTPFDRLVTAKEGISLEEAERVMYEIRKEKLPIIDENGKIRGLVTMKDLEKSKHFPYSSIDSRGRLLVGATIGATGDFMERAAAIIEAEADCVLIDIAHGDSEVMRKAVESFKAKFPNTELVCGNVGTRDGARFLADLGADAVKVGIGPGHGCRTRIETGVGVPQMQAIREAYLGVDGRVPIIADGGIEDDGEIAKAIFCGADTVMLGSMIAGTDESPGVISINPATKKQVKKYRGMTSPDAVLDRNDWENPSEILESSPAQEGQPLEIDYVGSVVPIIKRIREHLQSTVSYTGQRTLSLVHKLAVASPYDYFINKLTEAAQKESFDR